jgi:hypothetical protein
VIEFFEERNYHQRGEVIMAQGVLSFKYEEEKKDTGMTALAGLPVYLDLASVMGINESIEKHLHIKQQGWTDRQTLLSLILMNLAGGDCVDDLRKLEGDEAARAARIGSSLAEEAGSGSALFELGVSVFIGVS